MAAEGWLGIHESALGGEFARMCDECVGEAGVDGAGLAVFARDGTPETVHATNPVASKIEDLQFTTGEGPCVDAALSGLPVLVPRLGPEHHSRWPVMTRELASVGVGAVFAIPIRVGTLSIGSLDLHRHEPGPLTQRQLTDTLRTVDRAASMMLTVTEDGGDGLDRIVPTTTYRMVVHQAVGMAMVQLDVSLPEALLRLRATAYAEDVSINALPADIVARRRRLSKEET